MLKEGSASGNSPKALRVTLRDEGTGGKGD